MAGIEGGLPVSYTHLDVYKRQRQNGYVGGYMTKKLVEMAEQQMSGK